MHKIFIFVYTKGLYSDIDDTKIFVKKYEVFAGEIE